jgi:hypothetical protein
MRCQSYGPGADKAKIIVTRDLDDVGSSAETVA